MSKELISPREIAIAFQTIQKYLMNNEWVESQDKDLVDALGRACLCQLTMFRVTAMYGEDQHKLSVRGSRVYA